MGGETQPKLIWEWGTAYDLFVSLYVLHHPDEFGVRGSWAAGVRSRVPAQERSLLQDSIWVIGVPLHWVHSLPSPKDGATVLWSLRQMPPAERLLTLGVNVEDPPELVEALREVAVRGSYSEKEQELLREAVRIKKMALRPKTLKTILDWWTRPSEFGERYLLALQAYYQVFFAEEENRIRAVLQHSLATAMERAEQLPLPDLLEELSRGIRFATLWQVSELVLAPSYWSTPLVIYGRVSQERMLMLYGARPATDSLVPGDVIPDALLQSLKALADPTRLRILNYLSEKPHTPAQLARRLRLRPPTVVHHLNALRTAGLVQLTMESGGERLYAARPGALNSTFSDLQNFLKKKTEAT
jgi:DNA-binding transcriptional ArsR family regulator